MSLRILLAVYFALPLAGILAPAWVPRSFVLVAMGAAAVAALAVRAITADDRATQGARWKARLTTAADHAAHERVASVLRLMAASETWRARALPEHLRDVLDDIVTYAHGMGFPVAGVLRVAPGSEELIGAWVVTGKELTSERRTRWALRGVGGAVARVLLTAQPVRIEDERPLPVATVGNEMFRPSTADVVRYWLMPVTTPLPRRECFDEGWLYRPGCPGYQAQPGSDPHPRPGRRREGLDLTPCLACRHFPIHAILVVGEDGRGPTGGSAEQLIFSLAHVLTGVFERAYLYREVRAAERFRAQALDAMSQGLLTTDARGRVVYANRAAIDFLGGLHKAEGRPLDELMEIPSAMSPLQRTLVEGMGALHLEGFLHRGEGDQASSVPIRLNLAPYRLDEGGHYGAVCVFEDMTPIRAMEDEIRHLDTLAAIGRFASAMAHEIRNPLGGISAGVGYLARSELTAEHQENIQVIQGEIARLDGIIRNLLSVARPRELRLAPVAPRHIVARAVESLERWAQDQQIRLQVRDQELPPIYVDWDMVQQVLVNILKNAVEASPRPGIVDVELNETPASETDGGGIRIAVIDHGEGIDTADLPRVFEPFFSRKAEGTGLGLYVCHSFVQRHGGDLTVERAESGGARFELHLPRTPARMGANHESATTHR